MASQHPEHSTEHPGIDFAQLSMEQYAALRGQLGIGVGRKEGKGIFDSVSSRSQAYADATRAPSGRTAYSVANLTEAPKLLGRQERQGDRIDYRSATERFSTPGNSFQI
jgi:hypothetical protein